MNIPTANILIGFGPEVMNEFFAGTTIPSNRPKGSLLFSNKQNSSLISFEHTLDLMEITFIDPEDVFLERYGNIPVESKSLYIAYGIGDDLNSWSGPHRMSVADIQLSLKPSRMITLTLVPILKNISPLSGRNGYLNVERLNFPGTMYCKGTSRLFNISKKPGSIIYDPSIYLELPEKEVGIAPDMDIHSIIVDTIRSYIQKLTNSSNVIVLLPDLNVLLRDLIGEHVRKNTTLKYLNRGYSNDNLIIDSLSAIKDILEELGLTLGIGTKKRRISPYLAGPIFAMQNLISLKNYSEFHEGGPISVLREKEATKTNQERYAKLLYENTHYATLIGNGGGKIPNHKRILTKTISSIKEHTTGIYNIIPVVLSETRTDVINFWATGNSLSEPQKYPLFGGYEDFNSTDPVIIFGDRAMILKLLYADTPSEEEENSAHPPINYLDAPILLNENYIKSMNGIQAYDLSKNAFNNFTDIPDNFSLQQIDSSLETNFKEVVRLKQIPIFKYNTTNPNVLDFKSGISPIYQAQINVGISQNTDRTATKEPPTSFKDKIIEDFVSHSFENIISYLLTIGYTGGSTDEDKDLLKKAASTISPEFLNEVDVSKEEIINQVVYLIKSINNTVVTSVEKDNIYDKFNQILQVKKETTHNLVKTYMDMLQDIYEYGAIAEIKTLPLFQISNSGSMNRQVLVFAQDTPVMQTGVPSRTKLNYLYSGPYMVTGFKHKINQSTVESEFTLYKTATPNKETIKLLESEKVQLNPDFDGSQFLFDPTVSQISGDYINRFDPIVPEGLDTKTLYETEILKVDKNPTQPAPQGGLAPVPRTREELLSTIYNSGFNVEGIDIFNLSSEQLEAIISENNLE